MKSTELFDAIDHVSESALRASRLRLLPANTVLIVVRGMILAHTLPVAITRIPATINQDMKALLPTQQVLPDYLHWLLISKTSNLLASVSTAGHGTKRLEMHDLLNLRVAIPPKRIQEKFVTCIAEIRELQKVQSSSRQRLDDLFKSVLQRAFKGEL
jgi:type I restriction enzyme, S subunit